MEKVTSGLHSTEGPGAPLVLPTSVPEISADHVEGACHRSARARRLNEQLEKREAAGKPLTGAEVDKIVQGATKDGKPDGDQAVVLAAHARAHPALFGGGHGGLLRFLARIMWRELLLDLRVFIAGVREQQAEERKRESIKHDLEDDRLEHDARKGDLNREALLHPPDAPPVDERLRAASLLRFNVERLRRSAR